MTTGGSLYRVDRDHIGVESLETLDLTRPMAAMTFDAAPATRVGPGGTAAAVREAAGLLAGLVAAADSLGGMERCLDMANEYAKTRIQYGRVIGSYQAIKHKLADLLAMVEITRTAVQHAAWMRRRRRPGCGPGRARRPGSGQYVLPAADGLTTSRSTAVSASPSITTPTCTSGGRSPCSCCSAAPTFTGTGSRTSWVSESEWRR